MEVANEAMDKVLDRNLHKTEGIRRLVARQSDVWNDQATVLKKAKKDLRRFFKYLHEVAKVFDEPNVAFEFVNTVYRILASAHSNLIKAYILANAKVLKELNIQLHSYFEKPIT